MGQSRVQSYTPQNQVDLERCMWYEALDWLYDAFTVANGVATLI